MNAQIQTGDAEAWRPALIAFYRNEVNPERVRKHLAGGPFDYMDCWTVNSIRAAVAAAPVLS